MPDAAQVMPPEGPTTPDPSILDAADVARDLGVVPELGLTGAAAAERLAADGPNELRGTPPTPAWRRFLAQFTDPLIHLLFVAIAISMVAWFADGASGVPVDALVIATIVLLNAVLGFVQESKAADAVAALRVMTAATSTVLRDGRLLSLPSSELVRGDILVLSEGDAVGADGRILTASALDVQEASLTGESGSVSKRPDPLPAPAVLGDRTSMVFKGTEVTRGVGTAVVTATGMATAMGSIAEMLDRTESDPSPLETELARVSRTIGRAVMAIAVVVMATLLVIGHVHTVEGVVSVMLLGVSLAVAAVPEGLPAILSVVLALGVRSMARRNAVVKDLHSAETLGSASVICSDKTGTLTRNEMTVRRIATASATSAVGGTGYVPVGDIERSGAGFAVPGTDTPSTDTPGTDTPGTDTPSTDTPGTDTPGSAAAADAPVDASADRELAALLLAGVRANNAQLDEVDGVWGIEGDPTEAALLVAARKRADAGSDAGSGGGAGGGSGGSDRLERIAEEPFTSERKLMSVLDRDDRGAATVFAKGAPDVLLGRCTHVLVGGEARPLDAATRAAFLATVEEFSASALRTLGLARRELPASGTPGAGDPAAGSVPESALVLLGVVGIIDPPRDEAAVAVAEAHRAGIRTIMITGDHPTTATRIALDLGIAEEGQSAVTGAELDAMDADEFTETVRSTPVFARVAPEHKLRIVDTLQADRQVVAMTGDGANDAPALKSADIGVAMGITGTEVTKEASDVVLGDDDYATIIAAVHRGRGIYDNIRKFLRYLLSSNLGEVVTVFFGVVLAGVLGLTDAGGVVLPLLATQILWINLITDSGPALALGVDPEIDDPMSRPPRSPDARILDRAMWLDIVFGGFVMGAVTLLTLDWFLPGGLIEGTDDLTTARTAAFTTLVLAQLFNVLNARSDVSSAFHRMFTNRWLWGAILLGVALQFAVVEFPPLQSAFGTSTLDLGHWVVCTAMASTVLWAREARKVLVRLRGRTANAAPTGTASVGARS